MDPLERELRDVLTSERRALPSSLVPLDRVHARAARRRNRRRAALGAVTVVVAAAVAIPVGFSLGTGPDRAPAADASPAPSRTENASPAPVGAPWDGSRVASMTATSTRTIVVLGSHGDTDTCQPGDCLRLAESHDAGRTFTALPAPEVKFGVGAGGPSATTVTDVRFGSAQDGWLFGDGLWSTHDGGYRWTQVSFGAAAEVRRLEAAAGTAWALVGDSDGTQQLWRSPVGADHWRRVPGVALDGPGDLAVQGDRVVVLGTGQSAAWSNVTGEFNQIDNPCKGSLAAGLSGSGDLWATCITGTAAYITTSADDGTTWSTVPVDTGQGSLPNSVALGARTAGEAVVVLSPEEPLTKLSADGSLSPVRRPPVTGSAVSYLGFTNRDIGYAVVGDGLWRTDDGGDTWRQLSIG